MITYLPLYLIGAPKKVIDFIDGDCQRGDLRLKLKMRLIGHWKNGNPAVLDRCIRQYCLQPLPPLQTPFGSSKSLCKRHTIRKVSQPGEHGRVMRVPCVRDVASPLETMKNMTDSKTGGGSSWSGHSPKSSSLLSSFNALRRFSSSSPCSNAQNAPLSRRRNKRRLIRRKPGPNFHQPKKLT